MEEMAGVNELCVIKKKQKALKETPFQRHLTSIASRIIQKHTKNNKGALIEESEKAIKYSKKENYVVSILLSLGEIEFVFEQLEQAPYFLSNFRHTKSLREAGINRFHYIIYHIESHLFRATGILDRMMILLNEIFKLGLSPEKCKAHNLLMDRKGKEGKYAKEIKNRNPKLFSTLINLMNLIDGFRDIRNEISHQSRYRSDRLKPIEMYHILQQEGEEEFLKPPFKSLIKKETDKAVNSYKIYMLKSNSEIRKLLDEIYGYLEVIWEEEYKK